MRLNACELEIDLYEAYRKAARLLARPVFHGRMRPAHPVPM